MRTSDRVQENLSDPDTPFKANVTVCTQCGFRISKLRRHSLYTVANRSSLQDRSTHHGYGMTLGFCRCDNRRYLALLGTWCYFYGALSVRLLAACDSWKTDSRLSQNSSWDQCHIVRRSLSCLMILYFSCLAATSANMADDGTGDDSLALSTPAIVGIAVGAAVVLACAAFGGHRFQRRRAELKQKRKRKRAYSKQAANDTCALPPCVGIVCFRESSMWALCLLINARVST